MKLKVQLGADKKVKIEGKGTIIMNTKSGIERCIDDVLFVVWLTK